MKRSNLGKSQVAHRLEMRVHPKTTLILSSLFPDADMALFAHMSSPASKATGQTSHNV